MFPHICSGGGSDPPGAFRPIIKTRSVIKMTGRKYFNVRSLWMFSGLERGGGGRIIYEPHGNNKAAAVDCIQM